MHRIHAALLSMWRELNFFGMSAIECVRVCALCMGDVHDVFLYLRIIENFISFNFLFEN